MTETECLSLSDAGSSSPLATQKGVSLLWEREEEREEWENVKECDMPSEINHFSPLSATFTHWTENQNTNITVVYNNVN